MTAVDIHPGHPHMLAVGMSDGNVAVYNLQKNTGKAAYMSTAKNGKHQDIVWQVTAKSIRAKIHQYAILV